jgi:hypothetical protein
MILCRRQVKRGSFTIFPAGLKAGLTNCHGLRGESVGER